MMHFSHNLKQILKNRQKGYTLLFAVLVSALVLGVGVSILNIARKELLLNASARESQYAFYAADTGYECARYWDGQSSFSTSTFPVGESISCGTDATNHIVSSVVTEGSAYGDPVNPGQLIYPFTFSLPLTGSACSKVTLTKEYGYISSVATTGLMTTIDARGYNVGWNSATKDCSLVNPAKVERALYATY